MSARNQPPGLGPAARAEAKLQQAVAALRQGKHEEARSLYESVLKMQPRNPLALHHLGYLAAQAGDYRKSVELISRAIASLPNQPVLYSDRGNALKGASRLEEAVASYDMAISLKADYADAHYNRGNTLFLLGRSEEALASYDRAIALNPKYTGAHFGRGNLLHESRRFDEALSSFSKAMAIDPNYPALMGYHAFCKMENCDWSDISQLLSRMTAEVNRLNGVVWPFHAVTLVDLPDLHIVASMHAKTTYPERKSLGPLKKRARGDVIRVGYYSADFGNHPTSYLMAEFFEEHDKERFETYGFWFGPERNDDMRARIAPSFRKFIDVRAKSVTEVAKLSRDIGIDIAINLGGYTSYERTGMFAERAAPIQVCYLGYPGSMGADYIDYVIADKTVIPIDSRDMFTERPVYMPYCYQVNDSKRPRPTSAAARRDLGLPEEGVIFCAFNATYKIRPATFDSWMTILRAVEGSVLWLLSGEAAAIRNLRAEAEARGVNADRLVFAGRVPQGEHLARHLLVDLFLDTLPYNAHTTASDALWMGVPVLTRIGRSFAGRVAASLLYALDLPELVTDSQQAYEEKAIALARDPALLAGVKGRLEQRIRTSPVFDGKAFAEKMEAAYQVMYDRYHAGAPLDVIEVSP